MVQEQIVRPHSACASAVVSAAFGRGAKRRLASNAPERRQTALQNR